MVSVCEEEANNNQDLMRSCDNEKKRKLVDSFHLPCSISARGGPVWNLKPHQPQQEPQQQPVLCGEQIKQFREKGYLILDEYMSEEVLRAAREEAGLTVGDYVGGRRRGGEREVVRGAGCVLEPYRVRDMKRKEAEEGDHHSAVSVVEGFVHGELTALAKALMFEYCSGEGRHAKRAEWTSEEEERVGVLNEQYIIKPPGFGRDTRFIWHQDAEYLPSDLKGLSCVAFWCALDDVHEENGTIQLLPFTDCPPPSWKRNTDTSIDWVRHHFENQRVLYPFLHDCKGANKDSGITAASPLLSRPAEDFGDKESDEEEEEAGTPQISRSLSASSSVVSVVANAGSIVITSGYLYHRGLGNISQDETRRVFMPQFYHLPSSSI
eukprot:Nk52_evm21s2462 gene=Nk52_evmTU21s2462